MVCFAMGASKGLPESSPANYYVPAQAVRYAAVQQVLPVWLAPPLTPWGLLNVKLL